MISIGVEPTESIVAAIYTRKSNEQNGLNDETKSVVRQVEHAKAFAEKKGWTVVDEYIFVDDGISGAEFEARDGLMRLLGALKPKPAFTVLIVMNKDRLGREQYESAFNLKRLAQAGVRVFEYLEGRESLLETPTEKFIEMVGCFAAEQERYQASRRTRDALARKAEQGHVTGGDVFGYRNEPVYGEGLGSDGEPRRQYVVRKVNEEQAAIVRVIFEMRAQGMGFKKIAKTLNEDGVMSPRPRRGGRPRSWAPSSVRGILFNPIYKGDVVWGRVKKRDSWGLKKYIEQPNTEWIRRHNEALRIVSDELWSAAHTRIDDTRAVYQKTGHPRGRPASGTESKYLLSGFAACGCCGGGMFVWSRDFKSYRKHIYVCGYHHDRGSTVCRNGLPMPMEAADAAVLDAIERDLMRVEVLDAAVEEAVLALEPSHQAGGERSKALEGELAEVEKQLAHYAEAIAKTGPLESLLSEIKQRESRRRHLKEQLKGLASQSNVVPLDVVRLRRDLRDRLTDWQGLLKRQTFEARQILRNLLHGRLIFTPKGDEKGRYYEFCGQGSISKIVEGVVGTGGGESRRGHHRL